MIDKKPKVDYFKLKKRCPYCHKSNIKLMTQLEFYGKDYGNGKLHVCQNCYARVGCHKGTDMPMGPLSNEELRQLRMEIHKIIDFYWETKEERKKVYSELGKRYGTPFHIGFLKNERARFILYDLKLNPISVL
jgi:zinc-finger-containing domain